MSDGDVVRLGNALLKRGLLSPEQLRDALLAHAERGGRFEDVLRGMGVAVDEPPASLGRYDLLREIGRGGMGVVYEGRDRELGRRVALKLLRGARDPAEAALDAERFLREARLAASIPKHPNVVGVYDVGVAGDRRYLAMELVPDARSFFEWRRDQPLPRQVAVLRDAALGLHHAHVQGVVHRDLKPENILVDAEGRPHVTDFGLAKAVGVPGERSVTAEGYVVGTPAYMSPEQARGAKDLDGRSDVWPLGVILYECLAGRRPFGGDSAVEILVKAAQDAPPTPSQVRALEGEGSVDRALEGVCLKALAKNPDDRYASAAAFAADLTRWLEGRPPEAPRARRPAARRAALAVALLAAAALAAAALLRPTAPPLSLLERVDPAVDALSGSWRLLGGELESESGDGLSVLSLPATLPEEYDLRVEFTPRGRAPDINVVGQWGGKPFQFYAGAQEGAWFGFGWIDGDTGFGHPSGSRRPGLLKTGTRHVVLLEVRRGSLAGSVDGVPVARLDPRDHELDVSKQMLPRHRKRLGLATWKNPTVFHRVELVAR
jgi:hypothetical protein